MLQDSILPAEVRSFLEALLESYPDLDIRLLAVARRREPSEEGHEALMKAMCAMSCRCGRGGSRKPLQKQENRPETSYSSPTHAA